ncbi:MAG: hypothetical protein GWP07_00990 [Xanthomonadaceae bacterium]|nr:hypothetical protein [Xanthomonadaceae bacterium]
MKKMVMVFFLLVFLPCQVVASNVSESNRLFDWAERSYSQYFSPAGQQTFQVENFLARYYPDTETYIATLGEDVFLYGDVFDGLAFVGQISDFIGPPPLQFSISSLQPYVPLITTAGSLGYAIYQNGGEISTGLIMQTLNPTGAILKSEEYEIELLKTMEGTLLDIENHLVDIDNKMDTMLLELSIDTNDILGNINDPHEYIGNIYNFEQELYEIGKAGGPCNADDGCYITPHQANQADLDQLASKILDYGPDGVHNQVNQIHLAITGSQSGNKPVLENFTETLIKKTAVSSNVQKYEHAYEALENYSMKLISGEIRGVNLLVDADLYQGNKNAAQAANDLLHQNIHDVMSLSDISAGAPAQYGFIYNTVCLMLGFADPYYDAPGHDGTFLPDEAEKIFKRAEFLKRRLEGDNTPIIVVYSITEAGEEVSELKLTGTGDIRCTCSPTRVTSHLIEGRGYDNWDGDKLKYNNQYQLNVYEFELDTAAGPGVGDYYVHGDGVNSIAVKVQAYNSDMTVNPEGDIFFGFGLLTKRDSGRFDHLKWHACYEDISYQFRDRDTLLEIISNGDYDNYMANDPLRKGVYMETSCNKRDHGDCINMNAEDPCDDISLCTSFTYQGDDVRNVKVRVKLYRRIDMDADIYHKTDGEVNGLIHLYIRDEDAEKNCDLYENKHQTIQGWEYQYEDTSTFSNKLELVPGHTYHMRLHMRANVHQGLLNTAGSFYLYIQAVEPVRFIFE